VARTPTPGSIIEIGDARIPVRPRLAELYGILNSAAPAAVAYGEIARKIWGPSAVLANEEASVRQLIYLLRNALEGHPVRIETYGGASKAALLDGAE